MRRAGKIAAALFFIAACRRAPAPPKTVSRAPLPDQTVKRFTMDSYSDGKKNWTLISPKAEIFEKDHRIELDSPRARFFRDGRKSSEMTAGRGWIQTENKDLWASENVVMTSTEAKLTTDWLRYSSADEKFISTAPVSILRGRSRVRGVGWEAAPDLSRILIHKQRVELAPEDAKKPGR